MADYVLMPVGTDKAICRAIDDLMKVHEAITNEMIAEYTGWSISTVKRSVSRLTATGVLNYEVCSLGAGRTGWGRAFSVQLKWERVG